MPIKIGNDTATTTEPTLESLGITAKQAVDYAAQRFGVAPELIEEAASALPDMGNTAQQIMQAAYNLSKGRVKVVKPDNRAAEAAPFDNRVTAEAYKAGAITKPERTWGQAVSDFGLGIEQGVNMGAEAVVGAANALVGFENPIEAAKRREKWNTQAESGKSAGLLVQNQKAEDDSKYLSGRYQSVGVPAEIADALATTGAILNNPAKLSDVAAQGVGSIAVSLPLTATTGVLGASAIMGGGAAANEAVDRIVKDDAAMAQLSDVYQQAFMETGSQDKALEITARKVQLPALVVGGALSALATKVTGGGKVEQDLLAGKMTAAKIPVSMLREGGEEALQSPSEQVGANVAIMDNIDRNQTYMEGTGKAFGEGLIGGMAAGGAMGAAGAASSRATQAKTKLADEITKLKVQRDEKLAKAQAAAALPAVGQASAGVDQMLGIQTANQLAQADSQLQGMMQDLGMIEQIERAQVMPQGPELKALAAQGVPVVEVTPSQPQPYPIQQVLDRAIDTQKQVEIEAAYRKRDAKLDRQKELDYVEAQLQALDEEHKKLRLLQSTAPVSNNALRDKLGNAIKEVEAKQAAQEAIRQEIMATGNPRLVEAGIEEMQGVEAPELPMAITSELAESYAPKLPENFADERLLDDAYRVVLGEVFDNTTKGGGVSLAPVAGTGYTGGDGNEYGQQMTRTKSINHPITQALIADGYKAEEVKAALDASLKGQKLGKRWQGLVAKALDYSNTNAADIRASMAEFGQAKAAEVAPDALGYGGATNAPFAPDNAQPVTLNDQAQPRGADDAVKYSFAGRKAKTANLDNLANAEARIATGEDAETVRQETGWHQGVDGKWRFEIDDSGAEVLPVNDTGLTHKLSDVLKHDALFEAYPALQNMFVSKGKKTYITGNHIRIADVSNYAKDIQAQENAIYREAELLQEQGKLTAEKEAEFEQLLNELDKSSRTDQIVFDKSSLMHEIQHAIQQEENFARGGSSSTLSPEQRQAAINEIEQEAMSMGLPSYERKLNDYVTGKITEDEYNDYLWDVASATKEYGMAGYKFELYQRLAGEVEARNTQKRLGMNAQERKLTAPSATQDVPNDKQIVRFDGGRAEMAISEQDGFIYIDGSKDIGYLDLNGYRESAPIRLEVGDKGYGLTHIELRHGAEIRNAGFESVEHFIKYVADNYTEVRKAKDGKLMLDVVDGRSGKAMLVQLQPEGDGSYWGISTAGIFNKRYINSFDKVVEVDRTSQQQVWDDTARFRTASSLQVPSLGEGASVTTSKNTTTTNLTKQAANDIISKDADGKRLLSRGKVKVLGSIDEAPEYVLEQAKRSEVASDTIMVDGVERSTRNSNGQLIHPTKQGIENFWRWFGDSKVVDSNGRPLVVYHGTDADFDEFRTKNRKATVALSDGETIDYVQEYGGIYGEGAYFIDRSEYASAHAYNGSIIPAYLNLKNPQDAKSYKRQTRKTKEKHGFDGVSMGGEYVAFHPNQIKSAIGNNGDFDPENKNILYSQDGNIQGFFDPVTDTTYLVADALTADTIQGVLVHEVGVHAWWAKANSDKKAALEKRAMQLLNQGKYGNEKIKAFYAAVEQRMIDADVQGNAEEAAAYIVEEAINQAGAERYALSDSRLIDAVAKVSKSLANWMSDFIAAIKASFNRIGWLNTANLTGADLVAIAKRNMRDVAQNDVGDNVGILAGNVAGNVAYSKAGTTQPASSLIAPREMVGDAVEVQEKLEKPADVFGTLNSLRKSFVNDLERVRQVQQMVNEKVGEENAIDLEQTIYTFRRRSAVKVQDLNRDVKHAIEGLTKDDISKEEIGLYLYARAAEEVNNYLFNKYTAEREAAYAEAEARLEEEKQAELSGAGKTKDAFIEKKYSELLLKEREKIDRRIEVPVAGSGMETSRANDVIATLEEMHPTIKEHAQVWRKMLDDSLDMRVQAGTLSEELKNELKQRYPNYVPMKNGTPDRATYEGDYGVTPISQFNGTGTKFNLTGSEIRKRKGRVTEAKDIIEHIVFDLERAIVRAEKNEVNLTTARLVARHKDATAENGGQLWRMMKGELPAGKQGVNFFYNGERFSIQINDQPLVDALARVNEDPYTLADELLSYWKRSITQWSVAFQLFTSPIRNTKEAMMFAHQSLGARGALLMSQYLYGAMRAQWRYERDKVTNEGIHATSAEYRKEWDRVQTRFRLAGGHTGFRDMRTLEGVQRKLNQDFIKLTKFKNLDGKGKALKVSLYMRDSLLSVLKLLEDFGAAVDNGTQLAAFRAHEEMIKEAKKRVSEALKNGEQPTKEDAALARKSVQDSIKLATNLTVNYARRGTLNRKIEHFAVFYTTATNSLVKYKEAVTTSERKAALAAWLLATIAYGLAAALQDDKDDNGNNRFDLVDEYKKLGTTTIMLPGGGEISLPETYGLQGFAAYFGKKVGQMIRYEQTEGKQGIDVETAFNDLLFGAAHHFNPIGGVKLFEAFAGDDDASLMMLSPDLLDSFVGVLTNKNAFGNSLYPENKYNPNDTPDSEKVYDMKRDTLYTTIAKTISETSGGDGITEGKFEVTPAAIESTFKLFTGGLGTSIEQLGRIMTKSINGDEITTKDIPIVSSVVTHKDAYDRRYSDAFRDLVNEIKDAESKLKEYDEKAQTAPNELEDGYKERISLLPMIKKIEDENRELRKEISDLDKQRRETDKPNERAALQAEIDELKARRNANYAAALPQLREAKAIDKKEALRLEIERLQKKEGNPK